MTKRTWHYIHASKRAPMSIRTHVNQNHFNFRIYELTQYRILEIDARIKNVAINRAIIQSKCIDTASWTITRYPGSGARSSATT
jgi:hypothetical protein